MRFTYVNSQAWQVLLSKESKYPDGAIFAKTSYNTKNDPSFPSSLTPLNKRRLQFMVRDKKQYTDTQGWGYALFTKDSENWKQDLNTHSKACAACHQIVSDRDYVFSTPTFSKTTTFPTWETQLKFQEVNRSKLPSEVLKKLPQKVHSVYVLDTHMSNHYFSGTLDEIRPLLTRQSFLKGKPSLFLSNNKEHFSLVIPQPQMTCKSNEKGFLGVHSLDNFNGNKFFEIEFCHEN